MTVNIFVRLLIGHGALIIVFYGDILAGFKFLAL